MGPDAPKPQWVPGPERPRPPRGEEVHVWRAELGSVERGERRELARTRLRGLLGRYLELQPEALAFELGEHGKPRLAGPEPALEFNLSHSGELALIAVAAAGRPVGVDLEEVKPRGADLGALAARMLDPDEAAAIAAAPAAERPALFFPAWARHEARVKCGGGGIAEGAPEWPLRVAELDVGPAYAGAVALAGEQAPAVSLYRLERR